MTRAMIIFLCVCLPLVCIVGCTYSVVIDSEPQGAEIYADGNYVGKTPVPVRFHTIEGFRFDDLIAPNRIECRFDGRKLGVAVFRYESEVAHLQRYIFNLKLADSVKPREKVDIQQSIAQRVAPHIRNIHLLIIGVGTFDDKRIPSLPYAEADAKYVYEFFHKSDVSLAKRKNVHLLTSTPNEDGLSATKSGISQAIEKYLVRRAANKDDLVIVFFAGHGDQDDQGRYYWVPSDARRGSLISSAYPEEELNRLLAAVPARNRMVISDACHAGALSQKRDLRIRCLRGDGENQVVISSCKAAQLSGGWEEKGHGVFTWTFVEGLQGNADSACGNADDSVTLGELKKYLEQRVPKYATKAGGTQNPTIKMPKSWETVYLTK